jgi:hypothetical protein
MQKYPTTLVFVCLSLAGCQQSTTPAEVEIPETVAAERVVAKEIAATSLTIVDADGHIRMILDSDDDDPAVGASFTMYDRRKRVKLRITEGAIGNRIALSDPEGRPRITIDVFDDGRIMFAPAEPGAGGWFLEESKPLRE